jgi:hypothetical protein
MWLEAPFVKHRNWLRRQLPELELFSGKFRDRYQWFMNACFLAFTGAGEDAKLQTNREGDLSLRPRGKP